LNRRRGVKKCEADLIFDLSLLPTRRRRAGNRLDEMVRAHLKEAAIAPERRTLRTVLRDIWRSRAISLIDLPFCKCSRLIRPIVSTTTIPHRPLDARAGRPASSLQGGVKFARRNTVKARLHLLPLRSIIALTWRLRLARPFLWLVRVTDRYDGAVMRTVRRIVESAERCAVKSDELRRMPRP
jgi:hypothetical protein